MISPRFLFYLILIASGFIYGLANLSKLNLHIKILVFYLGAILISESSTRVMVYYENNCMPIYHILIPIQFIFFGCFYTLLLRKKSRLILSITFLAFIASILNSIYFQSLNTFPTFSFLFLSLFVVSLTLFHFKKTSNLVQTPLISQLPEFWINTSELLFFSLCLFYFGFKNLFHFNDLFYDWFIYSLTMLMYTCYILAIRLDRKMLLKIKQS